MVSATLTVAGRVIALDQDLYLANLDDWSPEVAEHLAVLEGIQLQAAHWEIIQAVQQFYQTFDLSPANRALVKYIAQQLGKEKGNSLYLNSLFNGQPAKIVSRLAGLPKPANCF